MKLGLSTITFRHLPLEAVLREARKQGFEYVDIAGIPGWALHLDFGSMTGPDVRGLRETLGRLGLQVSSFNVGSNISSKEDSETSVEFVQSAIRVAGEAGVPIITTGVGSRDGTRELSIRNIRKLMKLGEEHGVTFTLELPHVGTLAEEWEDALFYLDEIPEAPITFDTSHFHVSGGTIMDLEPFMERIKHIHLRDAKGSDISYVPGEGEFNFKEFFGLAKPRYNGVYVLELETHDISLETISQKVKDAKAFVTDVS